MPLTDPPLWATIRDWPLPHRSERDELADPARLCRRFEHNLRKIGDWTDEASKSITLAYRKFLYLKAVSGGTLTPPKWIDTAWHLHLSFARDYAALEAAIGRPILHRKDLRRKEMRQNYENGRSLWQLEFDEEPPKEIWPSSECLRRLHNGIGIALVGFVLWGLGCFLHLGPKGPVDFALLGTGFSLFLGGAFYGGSPFPETISRCG